MREVHTNPEVIAAAVVDGINSYINEVLIPRCPQLVDLWDDSDWELTRLKHEVAGSVAAKWAVYWINDDV